MSGKGSGGSVSLVGAGPGDPDLITVAGRRALSQADVVVYDRLVDPRLLRHARPDAEMVFAGKSPGGSVMSQEMLNALLIERARAGVRVCRLKGGDPFVFGRGGEEAAALAGAGIPFSVVPGVTSAIAAPAHAGIPVTQRGISSSLAIVSGHDPADKDDRWARAAAAAETAVVMMGVQMLPEIVDGLIAQGVPRRTPAAVIQEGTLPGQRTVEGPLESLAEQARQAGISHPAVIVIGEVARLRDRLRWFDSRPLSGRQILVTRPRDQAEALLRTIAELGGDPIELPLIRTSPLADPDLSLLDRPHDWVIFTSANGARYLAGALFAAGRDVRALGKARLAAVGPATAAALRRIGLREAFIPSRSDAEGILAEFPEEVQGRKIVLVRAKQGRETLPETLRSRGARVKILAVYETLPDMEGAASVRALFESKGVDAITFASPSAVRSFRDLLPEAPCEEVRIVCIGRATAETASASGLRVAAVAQNQSAEGIGRALVSVLSPEKNR